MTETMAATVFPAPDRVSVGGEEYRLVITPEQIRTRVAELGRELDRVYQGRRPVVLGVLNGAVIFLSDLLRAVSFECEIDFVKISSYGAGKTSSGKITEILKPTLPLRGRDVLVVEDIIDSGLSLRHLLGRLDTQAPASLRVAALLQKPEPNAAELRADFVGFPSPAGFVVGYGLDCNGLGRNLPGVYELVKKTG